MKSLTLALLLAVPVCAFAQPPVPVPPMPVPGPPTAPAIKLPAKVTVAAGDLAEVKADTTAKRVKWVALTPGLKFHVCDDSRSVYVTGLPGTYELLAYTATGDEPSEPARVTVVIGDPPAPVPPPQPPAPPQPPDPLKAKLTAAHALAAGTPAEKQGWAKDLAALYRAAAKLSNDPKVTTAGALKAKLSAAAEALVGDTALTEVRQAVAGELTAIIPADGDLTAGQRAATSALFTKLATYLEVIAQ